MFCKNCGKQIDEGTKFCNNCGASQEATAQATAQPAAQPAQTVNAVQPTAPQKNNAIKIIIVVAVAVVCALIGRFVIAPSLSTKDEAERPASNILQSQNESSSQNDSATQENEAPNFSESTTTNGSSNSASTIKTKMFEAKVDDALSSQINLSYKGDTATSIIGYINIYDLSLDAYKQIKSDTDICKQLIEDNSLQGATITDSKGNGYYTVSFSFSNLDFEGRESTAELAAAYTSTAYENGKISASAAEKTLLSNGYTLIEER